MEDFIIKNNELLKVNINGEVTIPVGVTSINEDALENKVLYSLFIPSTVKHIAQSSCRITKIFVSEDNPFFYSVDNAIYSKDNHELIPLSSNSPITIKKESSIYYYYPSSGVIKNIVIGKDKKEINFVELNSFTSLEKVNIDKDNPFFSSFDGIVYNKDKTTLLYIPYYYRKEVKILKTVKEVCFKYSIYDNIKGFSVEEGNETFIANEGALFRKNGDNMFWDTVSNKKRGTLFIPANFTADSIHPSSGVIPDPILYDLWIDLRKKENKEMWLDSTQQLMKENEESFMDNIYIEESNKKVAEKPLEEKQKLFPNAPIIEYPKEWERDDYAYTYTEPPVDDNNVDLDFCNYFQINDSELDRLQNLEYIEVSKDNIKYASYDGILYSKDMSVLLFCPKGRKGKVVIKNGTKKINTAAFRNCKFITSVVIPHSVVASGICAFENCINLTDVSLSLNMIKLSSLMFSGCVKLSLVNIPEGVTKICKNVFAGCNMITSLQLPSSLQALDLDFIDNARCEVTLYAPKVDHITKVVGMLFMYMDYKLIGNFGKPMRDFAKKYNIPILSCNSMYENR